MGKGKYMRIGQRVLGLLVINLFFTGFLQAQKINGRIVLVNEQLSITPKEFYIAGVKDERDDKGAISALKQFMENALTVNKTLRPVIIHIKKFKLEETPVADARTNGKIDLELSFGLEKDEGEINLTNYKTTATYTRATDQQQAIEPALRHAVESGLTWFNTWINNNAGTNIKLATGTHIAFTDYTEQPENDTIYYSPKRPLTWDDFKGEPQGGRFEAEVLPSIGYAEQVGVIDGIVDIHLAMKVFLPKSASWVRAGGRNAYSLNHEQRHFDIVKVVALHFEQKLRETKLPVDNYDGYINVQYLDSFHEMNELQKQYDNETAHGTNQYAQQQWNDRIDKELAGTYGSPEVGKSGSQKEKTGSQKEKS